MRCHSKPNSPFQTALVVSFAGILAATSGGCFDGEGDNVQVMSPDDEAPTANNAPLAPPAAVTGEVEKSSPLAPFAGSYRHAGGTQEQKILFAKIESVASGVIIFGRGIAREKLAAGNVIPKELKIEAGEENLSVAQDGKPLVAALEGEPIKVKAINGEVMDMTYRLDGDVLEQHFKGRNKGRVNRYEMQGDKLVIHVRVYASQLPKELVYDLTYDKI